MLKDGIIGSSYKNGSSFVAKNYWPVSLISTIGKILKRIRTKLIRFLEESYLLTFTLTEVTRQFYDLVPKKLSSYVTIDVLRYQNMEKPSIKCSVKQEKRRLAARHVKR